MLLHSIQIYYIHCAIQWGDMSVTHTGDGVLQRGNYVRFLREAATGDLLLFSGNSRYSKFISFFTTSPWTHVGVVVKSIRHGLCMIESVNKADECVDVVSGRSKSGVRMVSVRHKIEAYKGKMVVWRRVCGTVLSETAALAFYERYKECEYERNKMELMRSSFSAVCPNRQPDTSSMFCSELIAQFMMEAGIIDAKKRPSNAYTPCDLERDVGLPYAHPDITYSKSIVLVYPRYGMCSMVAAYEIMCCCGCIDPCRALSQCCLCLDTQTPECPEQYVVCEEADTISAQQLAVGDRFVAPLMPPMSECETWFREFKV